MVKKKLVDGLATKPFFDQTKLADIDFFLIRWKRDDTQSQKQIFNNLITKSHFAKNGKWLKLVCALCNEHVQMDGTLSCNVVASAQRIGLNVAPLGNE